jgi:hypothetical protein
MKEISKKTIILSTSIFVLIVLIFTFLGFKYAAFKIKGEGIAIGYSKAAISSYQMGRPIPDTIFEEDNFRIEVKSQLIPESKTFSIIINVKDKYTNITHFSYQKFTPQVLTR